MYELPAGMFKKGTVVNSSPRTSLIQGLIASVSLREVLLGDFCSKTTLYFAVCSKEPFGETDPIQFIEQTVHFDFLRNLLTEICEYLCKIIYIVQALTV